VRGVDLRPAQKRADEHRLQQVLGPAPITHDQVGDVQQPVVVHRHELGELQLGRRRSAA
jgi:hypothetical protein